MERRNFLQSIGLLGLFPFSNKINALPLEQISNFNSDREYWVQMLSKIAEPLLTSLANEKLKLNMPVEARTAALVESRKKVTHLEGFGRLLCGMAPWMQLANDSSEEGRIRERYFLLIQQSLANAVNPNSKDYMNFTEGQQPLVDAAFLALALIRAPKIWNNADDMVKKNLLEALGKTRLIKPHPNNWLLFSGMIEAFLLSIGEEYDKMRIDYAIRQHDQWYKGDGAFGDGADFHWDYYNSYVIQPFISVITNKIAAVDKSYLPFQEKFEKIALRYSSIQEKLIAPDGSFPAIGRSLAYRCGAFHHLAHQAFEKKLPSELSLGQVRSALSAVIHRTLDDEKNFNQDNWLRLGLCGYQPDLAEDYISTGSLYLCATAFLPLGLAPEDTFWKSLSEDWTAKKIWMGNNLKADKALKL